MKKIMKVDIITRPSKLDELKDALIKIGVEGITVSQVYGCGLQKGYKEYYRGREVAVNLMPKVKIETVVCDVSVEKVMETAQKALYTGEVGDGKIFVYEIENAMRIRTGTIGTKAITDNEI